MGTEQSRENPESGKTEPVNQSSKFLKYSGLATQMLGTILLFTYAGYRLDGYLENKVPVWTLILSLTSIGASLFMLIRGFTKLR